MDHHQYLEDMGITVWRCRQPHSVNVGVNCYCYWAGSTGVFLFDAVLQNAAEVQLVEAIVKATQLTCQGGFQQNFTLEQIPSSVKIILALGQQVAEMTLQQTVDIEKIRGQAIGLSHFTVIASYAPPQLLAQKTLKAATWKDVQLAMRQII